ncbi:hypothetical protein [Brevundimonas sp.]|uniref:hypothetical protein n=1 Tax=Brevundimonas sp. TaxID=1871086 RepID=UPI003569D0CC
MSSAGAAEDAKTKAMERDARIHQIGCVVVFVALCLSALLPERYSLFSFAFPFGAVAVAAYYLRFRVIANLEIGLVFLALIICLQAMALFQWRLEQSGINKELEQIACRSDLADRAGPELCEQIYGVLNPEPIYDPE